MGKKLIILVLFLTLLTPIFSQDTIKVGIKESPPFTIYENGEWSGISIDILSQIKSKTNYVFQFHELNNSYDEVMDLMYNNSYDLFVSSTTITGGRLNKVDFTQPFFIGSIGVATNVNTEKSIFSLFFTWSFMKNLLYLSLFILICGILFWLFERGTNNKIDKGWKGIFEGAFFASFTMTTVGYTDTVTTKAGKILAFILMWLSIGFVGLIYGNITTALTVSELENNITEVSEMKKLKVGAIYGSTSSNFLENQDIKYISYNNPVEGLDAILDGELDAFVYDTPVLKYLTGKDKYSEIQIIPQPFSEENYGFCTPKGSKLINEINPIIVDFINSDDWNLLLVKYNIK